MISDLEYSVQDLGSTV